jgi:hypothetical protein
VLLSSLPDERHLAVAADSGIALLPGVGIARDLISLVRAKQLAQDSLAQAQALLAKRAEEESIRATEATRVATIAVSVAVEETSMPGACPVRSDEQPAHVILKTKRAAKKKPMISSSTLAPRLLRKTPAR